MKHQMKKHSKRILRYAVAGAAGIVGLSIIPITLVKSNEAVSFHQIAHRGYSEKYFQNTYAAFKGARDDKEFWGAETDLQMSKNGTIWCSHYINPFETQSQKIDEMTDDQIKDSKLKIDGSIDTSTLNSSAYPSGKLNPYNISVPDDADNNKLCLFWDNTTHDKDGKGFLNTFLDNNRHPAIELKMESCFIPDPNNSRAVKIDQDKLILYTTSVLDDVEKACENDDAITTEFHHPLEQRLCFISFFDDALAEIAKQIKADKKLTNPKYPHLHSLSSRQYQKLLDDGAVTSYVQSDVFPNTEIGNKSKSLSNIKSYKNYIDGSWCNGVDGLGAMPVSLDVYYALLSNSIIIDAHKNDLDVNVWTANYSRLEFNLPFSMQLLINSNIDMITQDDYYNFG